MSDPVRPSEEQASRENLTSQTKAADPPSSAWIEDPYASDRYLVPEEEIAQPVPEERLFPRKVLVAWAVAALTFWFLISFVAPVVKQTIKETVVQRLQERGVDVKVNGHTIEPVVPAEPSIPALPAVPAVPTDPAQQAVPAPGTVSNSPAKAATAKRSRR